MTCPGCGGRHGTSADRVACMAASLGEKRRDEYRAAFGLTGDGVSTDE